MRLRPNILEQSCVASTKGLGQLTSNQSSFDQQRDNIDMTTQRSMDKLSWIDCGSLYASPMDLQKHVKRGFPEASCSDEEISVKRRKDDQDIDQGSENESDESDVDEEETALADIVLRAYDRYDDMYQEKIEEFMEEMDEVRAEKKAYYLLRSKYKKYLIKEYRFFLLTMYLMKRSPVHRQIKDVINKYVAVGYNYDHATN